MDGVVGLVGLVGVVGVDGLVRVDGLVGVVTLLAEHYFVQIVVRWWSLLLDVLWVLCDYVYLVPRRTTTTIHESLVNRLTYGCKPVKSIHL